jgi:hypothetical protein
MFSWTCILIEESASNYVRFEVFKVVTMKNAVFWDVAVSSAHTLVPRSRIILPWRWRRYVSPKRRLTQDLLLYYYLFKLQMGFYPVAVYYNKTQHTNNTHYINNTPHSKKHSTRRHKQRRRHPTAHCYRFSVVKFGAWNPSRKQFLCTRNIFFFCKQTGGRVSVSSDIGILHRQSSCDLDFGSCRPNTSCFTLNW